MRPADVTDVTRTAGRLICEVLIAMARRSTSSKPRTTKSKYSALYVGCSPCNELPSVDDIAEGVRDLVRGGSSSSASSALPRLSLTVSGKGLKVVRPARVDTGVRRQRRRWRERGEDSVRHALTDIVLVGHGVDSDVRAAAGVVLHSFDSGTGGWLHMHVYWFDDGGPDTAARFVRQISELIDTPQHRDAVKRLESTMIASGQLRPRSRKPPVADFAVQPRTKMKSRADGKAGKYARHRLSAAAAAVYRQPEVEICRQSSLKTTDDCKYPEHQPRLSRTSSCDLADGEYIMWYEAPPPDAARVYENGGFRDSRHRPASLVVPQPVASLASELRARLATGAPILLPPKDYDTVSRSRGNLNDIDERRCVNANIVGGVSRRSDTSNLQTYF